MGARDNIVTVVAGQRGAGKTDYLKNEVIFPSLFPKTLIVDTYDNPAWRTLKTYSRPDLAGRVIPIIHLSDFSRWENGIYRVFSGNVKEIYSAIRNDLWNCNVIFDDASKYLRGRVLEDVTEFLFNSKQRNVDITLAYHALAQVPPEIVYATDYFTIFKTKDGKLDSGKYSDPDFQLAVDYLKKFTKEDRKYLTLGV